MDDSSNEGNVRVEFSDDGYESTIVVDRERKLNALTLDMLRQLENACRDISASKARVVVLRTAGDKVFCVGADINHFRGISAVDMWREWVAAGHRAFDHLASLRQPTIAVIDGLAFGGGLELALACDIRIMADSARLSLPEVGLGAVPGWGGTERVTEIVGRSRAKELIFTRRQLTASEALQWGIVNRISDREHLEEQCQSLVVEMMAGAPVALQLAKQIIDGAADGAPSSLLEALASGVAAATSDLLEGTTAFGEKRPPIFKDE